MNSDIRHSFPFNAGRAVSTFLAAALLVAVPRIAEAAPKKQVLCRDSKGKITVAASCRRGSTPLSSSDLTGPPGAAGRGVNDALAGGTSIRGAGGGMFVAPGANTDPWVVVTPFSAVLSTPLTEDKILIAQRNLRTFCNAADNSSPSAADKANDCLRTSQLLNGETKNQAVKPGQFTVTTDNVCSGTAAAPTAPAGFLCIYLVDAQDFNLLYADTIPNGTGSEGFSISWISNQQPKKSRVNFVWAYTAP